MTNYPNKRYGMISFNDKMIPVHRISAMLYLGFDIKSANQINHKCPNTRCFNPEHLYIGTQSDNMKDASRDGTLHKYGRKLKYNAIYES